VLTASVQHQAPVKVSVNTHRSDVPDTTWGGNAGNATQATPGGPQWAWDNLEAKFDVTQAGPGTWNVTLTENGSYAAFASPITGGAMNASSPVQGWVTYTVTSTGTPSGKNLPAQSPGTISSSHLIRQLFGDQNAQVAMQHYSFSYKINGTSYSQAG
jgi:hypothetical protein